MITFFDASALVKNYIEEDGSTAIRDRLADTIPAASRLSAVEVTSAFARRFRDGELSVDDHDRLVSDFHNDLSALYLIELSPEVTDTATSLLHRHRLRAADAIQLASCLVLQRWMRRAVHFAAFDQRLLVAARHENLAVIGGSV